MGSVDFIKDNRTVVVKINEEIDHHACERIRSKIDLAIEFRKAKYLVFDFEGVNFMDSSGIGLIMGRYKLINKHGGQAFMVNLNPAVKKIFQMSGIFKILSEEKNMESILQKIKAEV